MRVLVIGGNGFIGGALVPLLRSRGHAVGVVQRSRPQSRDDSEIIVADRRRLTDHAAELRAFQPDIVVDLILSSGRQAHELMEVFRGFAKRIVVTSSIDVYRATAVLHGSDPGPLEPVPLSENSALRSGTVTYPPAQLALLQQVFGWLDDEYDKLAVERALTGDSQLPATILRLPMIYGPGDRLNRCFPLLKRMDDNRPFIVMSDRVAQWRGPRGYVENVAAAVALAVSEDRAAGRVYNVAERESFSELEWARQIASAAGWSGEVIVVPDQQAPATARMPGRLEQHWVADTSRIRNELGYAEPVNRPAALERTIAWQRAHVPAFDAAAFDYAAEDASIARSRE